MVNVAQNIDNQCLVDKYAKEWVRVFHRLTFVGFARDQLYAEFDAAYGEGNWIPAHFFDGRVVSRLEGYYQYEQAYYEYLRANAELKEWIENTASEVYDIQLSNIACGLDYTAQECGATHLQDISVRRVLTRLELERQGIEPDRDALPTIKIFHGDHPVQIRGHETEGFPLNPGQVPFHRPELAIGRYEVGSWWKENSAEDIYQRNKVLLVNPNALRLTLEMVTADCIFLAEDKKNWYSYKGGRSLNYVEGRRIRRDAVQGRFQKYCEVIHCPRLAFPAVSSLAETYLSRLPDLGKKKRDYEYLAKPLQ